MKKRITAALLALMMLISLLPTGAFATEEETEEKIYQLGEQVWIQGTSDQPTGKTEKGTLWAPVLTEDGMWESKAGECPIPEHRHSTSCYNAGGKLLCELEIHRHGPICKTKNAYYLWEVVVDKNYIPPEETQPEESEPEEEPPVQGPGYSDPNKEYPEGSASFTLRNIGPDGTPLQDVEYYLLSPNNEVKGHFLTNENGEIFFGGLQLADGVSAETWVLSQNPPLPESLEELYEHNREKWDVTVVRNGDSDTFFVSNILSQGIVENPDPQQGYDNITNTLTVVNAAKLYTVMVTLKPEGLEEGQGIPSDLKVRVTLSDPMGATLTLDLPQGGNPQGCLEDQKPGIYTVLDIQPENAEIDGYTLGTPYAVVALPKPSNDAERPILDQNYVDVGSDCAYPDFWIRLPYTKNEDEPTEDPSEEPSQPEIEISNGIRVDIFDDGGNPIMGDQGAVVALTDGGETVFEEFRGSSGYTLDLSSYDAGTYYLEQTVAPVGHHMAPERYLVEVSTDAEGQPRVVLKRETGFLDSVLGRNGVEIDPDTGNQIATFTNERMSAQVRLTCNVGVEFADGTWEDAALADAFRNNNHFTLTWTDASGEHTVQMDAVQGETQAFDAALPYGAEYRVYGIIAQGTDFQGTQEITGTVDLEDLATPIHISADAMYTVEPGVSQPLTMLMVDAADISKTLTGVEFVLTQPDVAGTVSYVTDDGGRMLIRGSYDAPTTFALSQVAPMEGYLPLNGAIQVDVQAAYASRSTSDPYVVVQNFVPTASHEAVQLQENGVYFIMNTLKEIGKPVEGQHSNSLLIHVVSESGSPVEGPEITMVCPDGTKKTYKNGDVIDLEALGMTGTFTLTETKSTVGHNIATEAYEVKVTEKNGKYAVTAKNTSQGLLDQIFNKQEIPFGPNNEWMLTFVNVRMRAEIRLTCEVVVSFTGGSWHDLEFEKKYKEETEYQFLLSWDDGYVREQGEAMLVHGEREIFDLTVPYGVDYEIVCVNENGYFDTTFRNAKFTDVDTTALKEGMEVIATNTYIIEPDPDAEPIEMHLVKVDATTKKPLEGVEFELLDADGRKMASYTTGEDGKVDIVDTLKIGGSYALKETKALSGYETPNPYGIEVEAKYKLFTASGKPVLKQSFEPVISSKAVEAQEDGSYLVKNYKKGQAPKDNGSNDSSDKNPKTADSFDLVLWGGILAVSMAGMTLVAADVTRKKRRMS